MSMTMNRARLKCTLPFEFLCHFDGVGADFVDSGKNIHAITAVGNATQSDAQSKFGGKSLLLAGGDYLSLNDHADWAFGANDFTIDFQIRPTAWTGADYLLYQGPDGSGQNYLFYSHDPYNDLVFQTIADGGGNNFNFHGEMSIPIGEWSHLALVRSGDTFYMFLNGTIVSLVLNSGVFTDSIIDQAAPLYIGSNGAGGQDFNGHIDELGIRKWAVWTENFTPPTAPYDC